MLFNITITKDILQQTAECGLPMYRRPIDTNCPFAVAIMHLIPFVSIDDKYMWFYLGDIPKDTESADPTKIVRERVTSEQRMFIRKFNRLMSAAKRMDLPEETFLVNIPDEVIRYYYPNDRFMEILKDSKVIKLPNN